MALSDEQRAMLRLLEQRDQGYEDIAALMGLSEADVRAKVVGALAQLEAEGEPVPDVPPPFPASGGGPAAKAPAAAPQEPATKLPPAPAPEPDRRAEPAAPAPAPPASSPAPAASPPKARTRERRALKLPSGGGIWPWVAAAAGVIAVVLAIVLIAGGGGDDSSSSTESAAIPPAGTASGEEGTEVPTGTANEGEPTEAVLKAVDGSAAKGQALFGRFKEKLALQVIAEGLEPTAKGQAYAIWLAQSEDKMLPLASTRVGAKGQISAQFEVPTQILAYLADGTFDLIYVTRVDQAELTKSLKSATKAKEAPKYTGEAVLRGKVTGPIVGAALREEEEREAEEKGE